MNRVRVCVWLSKIYILLRVILDERIDDNNCVLVKEEEKNVFLYTATQKVIHAILQRFNYDLTAAVRENRRFFFFFDIFLFFLFENSAEISPSQAFFRENYPNIIINTHLVGGSFGLYYINRIRIHII